MWTSESFDHECPHHHRTRKRYKDTTGTYLKGIFWTNLWVGTWLRDDLSYASAAKTGFIEKNQVELFNEKRSNMEMEQDLMPLV